MQIKLTKDNFTKFDKLTYLKFIIIKYVLLNYVINFVEYGFIKTLKMELKKLHFIQDLYTISSSDSSIIWYIPDTLF